jgi:N-acetylmuramoyl-L-alanine amidase
MAWVVPRCRGRWGAGVRHTGLALAVAGAALVSLATPAVAGTSSLPASTLTATVSPARLVFPTETTVSAVLKNASSGTPLTGAPVTLSAYYVTHPGAWYRLAVLTTDSQGRVSYRYRPWEATEFRLSYAGSSSEAGTSVVTSWVQVAPRMVLHAPLTMPTYTPVTLTGSVHPNYPRETISLFLRTATSWIGMRRVPLNSVGAFATKVEFTYARVLWLRVTVGAYHGNLPGASRADQVTVYGRTLRVGDTGADVRALQERLAALHYFVGAVDGSYGYDTMQAVVAFQKVNGLTRTGVATATVQTRLGDPVVPRLRNSTVSGPYVEVDLPQQVVFYAVNGHIVKIFTTSTGGGYTYYENGYPEQAITPTGHFAIQRKVDGWVYDSLGELWRPAYFTGGYAIHGEPYVPPEPVSHGCVRITIDAMNWFYSLIPIGMPVYVY